MLDRRLAAAPLLLAFLLAAVSARADEHPDGTELFRQGKELMAAGQTAEACKKFEAATALLTTPGVRLNLAACYEKLGRTATAWSWYEDALTAADRAGAAPDAEFARTHRDALAPRLAKLTIVVTGPARAIPGLVVVRDGKALGEAQWGVALPVDPGKHQVTAAAPGRKPWDGTVDVGEAKAETLEVPALEAAPEPAPQPPPPASVPPPASTGGAPTWAWVTGGLGIAALGVGAGFGVKALVASGTCNVDGMYCPGTATSVNQQRHLGLGMFVGFGTLGVAGVVAGVIGVASRKKPAAPQAAFQVVPVVGPDAAGGAVVGAF
jgi:hypothetical protein